MTGFATATCEDAAATIGVTIKTVNHRHLDVQLRMPQSLASIEAELRSLVAKHVVRGRVELAISLQWRQAGEVAVELNEQFTRALEQALEQARATGLVTGALTPGDLLRLPQALTIREIPLDADTALMTGLRTAVHDTVAAALSDLANMRNTEGQHLGRDLDERRLAAADLVERIAVAADEGRVAMEERITERVAEIRAALDADEALVAQEIVRWSARSDISEEVTRFRAHVLHWQSLADAPEPCGRKLDFLLQEMNREVNTMGSKADGLRVSELIISAKAELEKMREQVQNVECAPRPVVYRLRTLRRRKNHARRPSRGAGVRTQNLAVLHLARSQVRRNRWGRL
jgi:uncharacterized protein (TIGR00255 family)